MRRVRLALAAAVLAGVPAAVPAAFGASASVTPVTPVTPVTAAAGRQPLDVRVLAHVPAPGYPANTLITPDGTIWVGSFMGATDDNSGAPSELFHFSGSGTLLASYPVRGQTPGKAHGIQAAEYDAQGRLYLLDQNPARVVRFDPATGRQETYATFADVPTCQAAQRPADCSNAIVDSTPEPDYAAWLPDGSMLVTDYTQDLVWRVPPGGGAASVWLNDPHLDGEIFGPAGIVLMPDHRSLLISASAGGVTTSPTPTNGKLYRLTIDPAGNPGRLTQVWQSGVAEGPDGFAVARSGHIYLALVSPAGNAVVELTQDGQEIARVPSNPAGAVTAASVPFDEPSSVQFLGDRLIVTNHCYFTGIASHMVLFDIYAGETGIEHFVPAG